MSDAVRGIRLFALDVDGVLTDNAIFLGLVGGARVEFKRFDIQDGLGLRLLGGCGIEVALVSARPSEATTLRATELKIDELIQVADGRKAAAMQEMLDRKEIAWAQVAFLGDDLADVPVMRRVGLPLAVANAVPEVKALAAHVTSAPGGRGAVREAVEYLLRGRGQYEEAVERYLRSRDLASGTWHPAPGSRST
ncbi:MAG TPA: HAD hydrolase family protein [Gemmatimonadales bacterium]